METTNISQTTPESEYEEIRKILREIAESQAESDRQRKKDEQERERQRKEDEQERERRREEYEQERERQRKENEQERERQRKENEQERERQRKEDERQRKEDERQRKEEERQRKEEERQRKKEERQWKEEERILKKRQAELDRRIDKVNATLGAWANNHGSFAEEYFFNSFEHGKKTFFGEKFDRIRKNVHVDADLDEKIEDEYDILLINGKSIGIVEVKFKAHVNDLPQVMKKVETFRINYPKYANHRVYLGLASMAFSSKLEQKCIDKGIAIIKQVGGTVVINDEHLKVF